MTPANYPLPPDWAARVRSWWPDDAGGTKRFRDLVAYPALRRAFPFYGSAFASELSDLATVNVGAQPSEDEARKLSLLYRTDSPRRGSTTARLRRC
jgi:hypothetical protein